MRSKSTQCGYESNYYFGTSFRSRVAQSVELPEKVPRGGATLCREFDFRLRHEVVEKRRNRSSPCHLWAYAEITAWYGIRKPYRTKAYFCINLENN